MKQCFKCNQVKPLSEFYKHLRMRDGVLNKCKECTKLDVVTHRANNLDQAQAYDRSRSNLPHRKAARYKYNKQIKHTSPVETKARTAVSNAVRDGRIEKKPCRVCGNVKSQAHHTDYTKPLDVVWLCEKHHKEQHRKYDYSKLTANQQN